MPRPTEVPRSARPPVRSAVAAGAIPPVATTAPAASATLPPAAATFLGESMNRSTPETSFLIAALTSGRSMNMNMTVTMKKNIAAKGRSTHGIPSMTIRVDMDWETNRTPTTAAICLTTVATSRSP